MHKYLSLFLFFISPGLLSLPDCPDDVTLPWDGCLGSYLYPDGEMYAGEWKNNLYNGDGFIFYQNGDGLQNS